MKRWSTTANQEVENKKIDSFLAEMWSVCEKHGLALSHEDHHGSFQVVRIEEGERNWLMNANDATGDA